MPVNKDRVVREFQRLVSFDSESYEERQIADYLKARLTELGLEVREDGASGILASEKVPGADPEGAGNLFAVLPGNAPGAPILFSAHMDTVKPGKGKRAVLHEDGRITSEGNTVLGADDAGGLAAILEMLTVLTEDGLPHPGIEVLFPIAEEPYGQGSRVFDYSAVKAKKAYVLDLSGELGRAANAAPSILSFQIRVHGKSAHAGFCPEEGVHAIRIAAEAISKLPAGWVNHRTSINIGTIRGGVQRNIVPDLAEIEGEIRSLEHAEAVRLSETVRDTFSEAAHRYGGVSEFACFTQIRAYETSPESETVKAFQRACLRTGLGDGRLVTTFGGSDNNHFAQHGIEGLVVASAMQNVHTKDEYTTAEDLEKTAQLAVALTQE